MTSDFSGPIANSTSRRMLLPRSASRVWPFWALAVAMIVAAPGQVPVSSASQPQPALITGTVECDGKPVPDADVFVAKRNRQMVWGEPELLTARTDGNGCFAVARPDAWTDNAELVPFLWVATAEGRVAYRSFPGDPPGPLTFTLPPAGGVSVKVLTPGGEPVVGATVAPAMLYDAVPDARAVSDLPGLLVARAAVETDEQGSASLVASREELHTIQVTTPDWGTQSCSLLAPNAQEESIVQLRSVGRIRGRLVADDPEAVRGLTVQCVTSVTKVGVAGSSAMGVVKATSDAQGQFEIPAIADGALRIWVTTPPGSHWLADPPGDRTVRAGRQLDLRIPVKPAVRVHGRICDKRTGKPMSGIHPLLLEHGASRGYRIVPPTDDEGRFEVDCLPGGYYLDFSPPRDSSAWRPPLAMWVTKVPGGASEFEIPPVELAVARGRVVDDEGQPIAGAKIVRLAIAGVPDENRVSRDVSSHNWVTADDGTFSIWTDSRFAYQLTVQAEGADPAETELISFADPERLDFPDIVMHRVRLGALAGRVVDRQGEPIAGVTVRQAGHRHIATKTTSDDQGEFRLEGVAERPLFIFAEKDGFRFFGRAVEQASGEQPPHPLTVVLIRDGEPPARVLETLPPAMERERRLVLARKILEPHVQQVLAAGKEDEIVPVLIRLAEIDPDRVLQYLEESPLKQPFAGGIIRQSVAQALAQESPDDALAIAASIESSYGRAFSSLRLVDSLDDSRRQEKTQLLAQAMVAARSIKSPPGAGAAALAQIGEKLLDMGEKEQATRLLREAQNLAEELPNASFAGYARGAVAEELAQIDLPAALALTKDLDDSDRHHRNVAHELAALDPAEAERILEMVRDKFQREFGTQRICYRMAPVDLPRARRIADKIANLELRARAYGVMAQALAEVDPDGATGLLREAFAILERSATSEPSPRSHTYQPGSVAGNLLPVAEQIDPGLVDQFLWKALSLRLVDSETTSLGRLSPYDVTLATTIARYDRELAGAVLDPFAPEVKRIANYARLLAVLAVSLDPQKAAALGEELGQGPRGGRWRMDFAATLAADARQLGPRIDGDAGGWSVDRED